MSFTPSPSSVITSYKKDVDVGEELVRLGYAVVFQEVLNGKNEGNNLGCLQRMLVSH